MLARLLHAPPDFLIIGAQKGGTSSLYAWLCAHPQVTAAREKEVHYFDKPLNRSVDWYYRQFPLRAKQSVKRLLRGAPVLTGEATPMYLVHPHAPQRIARALPRAKLIVLLREPAARAFSQWQHNQRAGWEPLPLAEAIEREEQRIAPALAAMQADPLNGNTDFEIASYKTRGRYLEQLLRYEELFPRSQILVLCSEELFAQPARVYRQALAFLGLPQFDPAEFQAANAGNYRDKFADQLAELRRYFAPYNEALFAHLGRRLPWD